MRGERDESGDESADSLVGGILIAEAMASIRMIAGVLGGKSNG